MKNIGCEEQEIDAIVLAINETCMNIIQHGYSNAEDDSSCGEIIIEIFDDNEQVMFRITDFAERIDPAKIRPRNLEEIRPGGLGVHFINEVMDTVEYKAGENNIGNVVELRKKIICRH
jgi:sigma-B regulation protein RsbU (phosphoserine phosphatase)